MKHTLLTLGHILLFNFILLRAAAQPMLSVTHPEDQVFQVNLDDHNQDLQLRAEVTNTTGDTLRLLWTRYEMDHPSAWQTQVCDLVACYNPDINTNYDPENNYVEPIVLAPGRSLTLTLHVLPNGTSGAGIYDLDLSLLEDPNNVFETVVFRTTVQNSAAALSPAEIARHIRLFPNPATEYMELTNSEPVDQVVIYNILGRQVRAFRAAEEKRYYLTGLPDGMYLVSLVNNRDGILRTMRLSKRSFRP